MKGKIKRDDYLFEHIHTAEQIIKCIKFMHDEHDKDAHLFRENYHNLDVQKFLRELFGRNFEKTSTERIVPPSFLHGTKHRNHTEEEEREKVPIHTIGEFVKTPFFASK
jgi:hypothetical protein